MNNYKLTRFAINNIGGIKNIELDPSDSYLILIAGPNDSGKSSVCDAIVGTLNQGKAKKKPEISRGHTKGSVMLDLGGASVEWTLRKDKPDRLYVRAKGDSQDMPKAKTFLSGLFDGVQDPQDFLDMNPKQQGQVLMKCAGLNFNDLDNEDAGLRSDRTFKGQDVKRVKGALYSMEFDRNAPPEVVASSSLADDLRVAESSVREHEKNQKELSDSERDSFQIGLKIEQMKRNLESLEDELKASKAFAYGIRNRVSSFEAPQIEMLKTKLETVDANNEKVRRNQEYLKTEAELKKLNAEYEAFNIKIEEIATKKTKMIADAEYPVQGLSVDDDGGVLFEGNDLSRASSSQQMTVAVAIIASGLGDLRLIFIKNGNLLGPERMKELGKILEAQNLQCIMEFVGTDIGGQDGIILEDGEVAK